MLSKLYDANSGLSMFSCRWDFLVFFRIDTGLFLLLRSYSHVLNMCLFLTNVKGSITL
jgi:hypothetical protein